MPWVLVWGRIMAFVLCLDAWTKVFKLLKTRKIIVQIDCPSIMPLDGHIGRLLDRGWIGEKYLSLHKNTFFDSIKFQIAFNLATHFLSVPFMLNLHVIIFEH